MIIFTYTIIADWISQPQEMICLTLNNWERPHELAHARGNLRLPRTVRASGRIPREVRRGERWRPNQNCGVISEERIHGMLGGLGFA